MFFVSTAVRYPRIDDPCLSNIIFLGDEECFMIVDIVVAVWVNCNEYGSYSVFHTCQAI